MIKWRQIRRRIRKAISRLTLQQLIPLVIVVVFILIHKNYIIDTIVFAVVIFYLIIFPKHLSKGAKFNADKPRDIVNDLGGFVYTDIGFTVTGTKHDIKWSEIKTMLAFKRDLYTVDEINLHLYCDNSYVYKLSENTPGWFQFIQKIEEQFPQIEKNWWIEISVPAFEPKLTVIYDREGRTLEQIKATSLS